MSEQWVEIDVKKILNNLNKIQKEMNVVNVIPILKTNAYGHGIVDIAKVLSSKVTYLGVGTQEEGIELRKGGVNNPILILSPYFDPNEVITYQLTPTIDNIEDLHKLNTTAEERDREIEFTKDGKNKLDFHLKINTGMNRFGLNPNDVESFMKEYEKLTNVYLEGVFSHFASTINKKSNLVKKQLNIFKETLEKIEKYQNEIDYIHMANSEVALDFPEARFNTVRIGNLLYGQVLTQRDIGIENTYKIKSRIIDYKKVKKGDYVGYGATYKAKKDMTLGVIPFGIYHGFDYIREPANHSLIDLSKNILKIIYRYIKPLPKIYLGKTPLKVIGKPNMQFILVDVSHIEGISKQTEVEIKTSIFSIKENISRVYKVLG